VSQSTEGPTGAPGHLRVIHHEGYDPTINSLFVPAIKVVGADLVFISGVTAAPVYHDHPHRPEDFDTIPLDAESQARIAFQHLDLALTAAGGGRRDVVMLTRFFTHVAEDQDVINRVQGEFFQGHLPTSTTVEVKRLATDPRLRLEIQACRRRGPLGASGGEPWWRGRPHIDLGAVGWNAGPGAHLAAERLAVGWGGGATWSGLVIRCRLVDGTEHVSNRWGASGDAPDAYETTCGPLRVRLRLEAVRSDLLLTAAVELAGAGRVAEICLDGEVELAGARPRWVLCSGYQSWDSAGVVSADGTDPHVESWWTVGLADAGGAGLAAAAADATTCATRFGLRRSMLRLAWCQPEAVGPVRPIVGGGPGTSWRSSRVLLAAGPDVRRAMARLNGGGARPAQAPKGWLSWYHFGPWVSREQVIAHAELLAREPFRRLGYRLVQIDDGWQEAYGDWVPNTKFDGGIRAICREVARYGHTVGIWLAPFLVSAAADLAKDAPDDWFVVEPESGKRVVDPRHIVFGPMYVLDGAHPDVRAHLRATFARLYDEGVRYFKADFLYAGAHGGIEALRGGLDAIREGAQDAYLLASGAPLLPVAGLAEGCRIGPDTAVPLPDLERGTSSPTIFGDEVTAVARNAAAHHVYGGRFQLDPDVALVGGNLTLEQGRQLVTVAALAGGPFLVSDDLTTLPADRLALLTNPEVLTVAGGAPAVPDWEPSDEVLPATHWRRGDLLAVFNWTDDDGLVPVKAPGARGGRDLWRRQELPELRDGTPLEVPAHGVRLIRLHRGPGNAPGARGRPAMIGGPRAPRSVGPTAVG
jgi:enamine deaminase RidA (YjgF/YER057c/UK114 family)